MHLKSSVHSGGDIVGHMPPPTVSQITSSATPSSSSLIHSPDLHSNNSTNPDGMGIKKESSMTISSNAMNDELISVPATHFVSLQIAAAVKKAQHITDKRCGGSQPATAHLYQKTAHISNAVVNNHNESQQIADELLSPGKHIENGNNATPTATITTTSTNNNFVVRRYSDDYYTKDDLPSGSHLHHQQVWLLS